MTEQKQKSDLSRAFSEDGALKTHVGGQALLEGIMMRGKYNWSVAVREPEGGIYTEEHDLASGKDKNGWLYWPFIRGCRAFVESLALGYKALSIAAEHAFVEEEEVGESGEPGEMGGSGEPGEPGGLGELGEKPPALDAAQLEAPAPQTAASQAGDHGDGFSWKRDFGNPDEMIDALGAQRVLEVIDGDTGEAVSLASEVVEVAVDGTDGSSGDDGVGDGGIGGNDTSGAAAGPANESDKTDSAVSADLASPESASKTVSSAVEATASASAGSASKEAPEKKPLLGDKEMALSMVLGLVLGIVLFVVGPAFITNLIVGEYDDKTLLWNVVDGLLRIAVFIFYIWLIGRMSDIKRMFGYHGAEHKTIHCFEHGLPLTPENARSFPRLHVRCGTAFLIMVMIIAIFVYTVTPVGALIDAWGVPDGAPKLALVIVVRILLMPVIAGIAYEITVRWAGSHPDNPLVKVVLWPGMQMQYLTTREPDDGQIECAIAAMKLVLEREEREQAAATTTA